MLYHDIYTLLSLRKVRESGTAVWDAILAHSLLCRINIDDDGLLIT